MPAAMSAYTLERPVTLLGVDDGFKWLGVDRQGRANWRVRPRADLGRANWAGRTADARDGAQDTKRGEIAHRCIATDLRDSAYASLAATCIFRRSAAPTRLRFTSLFAWGTLSLRTCSRARFLCAWMAIDFSACECAGYTSPLRTSEALPSTCNLPSMRRCVRARQEPASLPISMAACERHRCASRRASCDPEPTITRVKNGPSRSSTSSQAMP